MHFECEQTILQTLDINAYNHFCNVSHTKKCIFYFARMVGTMEYRSNDFSEYFFAHNSNNQHFKFQ